MDIKWKIVAEQYSTKTGGMEYNDIHSLAFLKIRFKISYRTVQGIARGLSDYMRIEEMHLHRSGEGFRRLNHL